MTRVVLILFLITFNCQSQIIDTKLLVKKDLELSNSYKKYSENRHDYGENARDTILERFKSNLLKTLSNKEYAHFSFDSLSNSIKIISSKDNKLRIFSWDEYNGGTWHVYNSVFQYNTKNSSYTGTLSLEGDRLNEKPLFTDIIHFKIEKIEEKLYLVKGYGTHGHGHDFYVFRLLSLKDKTIKDCNKCFDGKDRFVFYKPRVFDSSPKYNSDTQEISYPEMKTHYVDGEDTGFSKPTGRMKVLKYKNKEFVKLN